MSKPRWYSNKYLWLFLLIVIGAGAFAVRQYLSAKSDKTSYIFGAVDRGSVVMQVQMTGTLAAVTTVAVGTQVSGTVSQLYADFNSEVKKDQVLAKLDPALFQTQLDQASASVKTSEAVLNNDTAAIATTKANIEKAKVDVLNSTRKYKMIKELFDEGLETKDDMDTAQATLAATEQRMNSASADLLGSRDSLSKTTVTSPIDGVVTALPVKEGEVTVIGTMNNAGTQLMTVSDMAEVEAVMMVDETSVPQVKIGQTASLSIDAYPGQHFQGIVTEVGSSPIPKNDPDLLSLTQGSEAINFKVKIRVQDPPDTIRPGFSVTAEIVTGRKEGANAIPIQALVVRDVPTKGGKTRPATGRPETEEGVYVVKNGKLEFIKVESGLAGELMIEVKKGPALGAEIVTGPFKALRQVKEGDRVVIEKESDKKKDAAKAA